MSLKGDFMTDHGFIGMAIGSKISQKTLREIAHKVSNIPGVIWVYHVKHVRGKGPGYNIIVEFDPRPGKTYKFVLDKIDEINKEVGREVIHEPIDAWIKQCSYKGPR